MILTLLEYGSVWKTCRGPRAMVFVTAYDQYALRVFEAGALDYLLKPFDNAVAAAVPIGAHTAMLAGVNRLLAVRFKQRHTLRTARQVLGFVGKEDWDVAKNTAQRPKNPRNLPDRARHRSDVIAVAGRDWNAPRLDVQPPRFCECRMALSAVERCCYGRTRG